MNINVPSGWDGLHVYVLSKTEHVSEPEDSGTDRRYLIVRERPSTAESWSEIVELNSEEKNYER